ncbi:MAG TPA: protein kinase [Polyangia bacterium]|jgi:serine/threonine-protein kinase
MSDLLVGQVLVERYRLVRRLGGGTVGVVFEADDLRRRERVAVKLLRTAVSRDHELIARLRDDAIAATAIGHPHIVECLDVSPPRFKHPYLVTKLLTGEDLAACLERAGRLTVPQAVRIVREVLAGLSAAHAMGVVHGDLKPRNVFLCRQGGRNEHVKLLDFGVAMLGGALTVPYAAPEQGGGTGPLSAPTDVWATGVMLHEMLTAAPGSAARERARPPRADLPPALVAVILRATAQAPGARFPSALAMAEALVRATQGAADWDDDNMATEVVAPPFAALERPGAGPKASPPPPVAPPRIGDRAKPTNRPVTADSARPPAPPVTADRARPPAPPSARSGKRPPGRPAAPAGRPAAPTSGPLTTDPFAEMRTVRQPLSRAVPPIAAERARPAARGAAAGRTGVPAPPTPAAPPQPAPDPFADMRTEPQPLPPPPAGPDRSRPTPRGAAAGRTRRRAPTTAPPAPEAAPPAPTGDPFGHVRTLPLVFAVPPPPTEARTCHHCGSRCRTWCPRCLGDYEHRRPSAEMSVEERIAELTSLLSPPYEIPFAYVFRRWQELVAKSPPPPIEDLFAMEAAIEAFRAQPLFR